MTLINYYVNVSSAISTVLFDTPEFKLVEVGR